MGQTGQPGKNPGKFDQNLQNGRTGQKDATEKKPSSLKPLILHHFDLSPIKCTGSPSWGGGLLSLGLIQGLLSPCRGQPGFCRCFASLNMKCC